MKDHRHQLDEVHLDGYLVDPDDPYLDWMRMGCYLVLPSGVGYPCPGWQQKDCFLDEECQVLRQALQQVLLESQALPLELQLDRLA
jgi:hypothetical protein